MEIIGSPYIVSLKYAFQNTEHLCLVMDLMIGGDLSYHLNERNFTIEETKYYSVRIIMALMTLHENGYVYRDLKPENVLLDAEGQSKISDLGLVAKIDENSKGLSMICGTRGYWAPEILLVDPKKSDSFYSFEVDWFSLGCCMFEFVMGISPFRTEEAYNWRKGSRANSNPNSINGKDIVAIPFLQSKEGNNYSLDCALLEMEPDLSEVRDTILRDLIRRLLEKDPKKRLGYNRNFQEIMSHEFFHDIQWNAVHTMIPPFKPSLKPNTVLASEVGEFSDEKEVKKVDWEYKDEELFKNWQYLSLSGMQEEFVEFLINQEHHQVTSILNFFSFIFTDFL
jgi:serine/threonine protein kinase